MPAANKLRVSLKKKVVIVTNFSSLAALEVVKMTTTVHETIVNMTTFPFQWLSDSF